MKSLPDQGLRRTLFNALTFLSMVKIMAQSLKLGEIFGSPGLLNIVLAVSDLLRGHKIDRILKERTSFKQVLTVMTVPY